MISGLLCLRTGPCSLTVRQQSTWSLGRWKLLYSRVRIETSWSFHMSIQRRTITFWLLVASNSLDLNGIKPHLVSCKRQFHAITYLAIQTQTLNAEFWFLAQMMVQQLFKQPSASKKKYSFTGSDCRANRWITQVVTYKKDFHKNNVPSKNKVP